MTSISRAVLNFAKDLGRTFGLATAGIALTGLGTLYLDQNVAGFRRIEGPSMSPTLNFNEYTTKLEDRKKSVLEGRSESTLPDFAFFTRRFELARGDVVILEDPKSKSGFLCKRVVALGDDQIVPLGFNSVSKEPVKLREGEVWVESDAGFGYKDSNLFGPVRAQTIEGKVLWAYNCGTNHARRIKSEVPVETMPRVIVPEQ